MFPPWCWGEEENSSHWEVHPEPISPTNKTLNLSGEGPYWSIGETALQLEESNSAQSYPILPLYHLSYKK